MKQTNLEREDLAKDAGNKTLNRRQFFKIGAAGAAIGTLAAVDLPQKVMAETISKLDKTSVKEWSEMPVKVRLVCGELVLDETIYDPEAELVLDELMVGEGPNRIRAIAIYADGMEVSSAPTSFGIKFVE